MKREPGRGEDGRCGQWRCRGPRGPWRLGVGVAGRGPPLHAVRVRARGPEARGRKGVGGGGFLQRDSALAGGVLALKVLALVGLCPESARSRRRPVPSSSLPCSAAQTGDGDSGMAQWPGGTAAERECMKRAGTKGNEVREAVAAAAPRRRGPPPAWPRWPARPTGAPETREARGLFG